MYWYLNVIVSLHLRFSAITFPLSATMTINEDHLRRLIRDTVHETLASLGIDIHEQGKIQADMLYLRRVREGGEEMARKARTTAIGVLVSTALYLLWAGVQRWLKGE